MEGRGGDRLLPRTAMAAVYGRSGKQQQQQQLMAALLVVVAGVVLVADAAPLVADWTTCGPPRDMPQVQCCTLPELMRHSGPPDHYVRYADYLRRHPLPAQPRVRPAAHLVAGNATYLEQLERAFRLWRELPRTDPRSLHQQVNLHCMYGGEGIVMQHRFPAYEYSIHNNWLWLPFHRWYTFFLERILASLVGDDQFVLPFWNWDNQAAELPMPAAVPQYFRHPSKYPALFDPKRNPRLDPGQPDSVPDLSAGANPFPDDPAAVRRWNNRVIHRYVVESTAAAPAWLLPGDQARWAFTSRPMRAGQPLVVYDNTFEWQPHGRIHGWVGDPRSEMEDFAMLHASVADPLFGAHHANVDRIWAVWQSLGGRDHDDPDFLDAAFFFYNEDAELVRVTVADALDHRKLMLDWQQVDNSWLVLSPPPASPSLATA